MNSFSMKSIYLPIILLFAAINLCSADDFNVDDFKAQLPKKLGASNVGKEFWFSFIPAWEESGDNNSIRIYVSSAVSTVVTIEVPGRNVIRQKTTIPNDIIEFELAPDVAQCYRKCDTDPPDIDQVYSGYGVHVYADQPIICYGVTRYKYTSDGFLGLPVSSLGTDYIVSSWTDIGDHGAQWLNSFTAITSAYDNNLVQFKVGGPVGNTTVNGDSLGETVTETMNTGDVWLLANGNNMGDLSGSRVTSTKPVSVVSGNFCTYIPENCAACDFITEMELPSSSWGTTYHVTPFYGRKKNSIIRVYAKEENTNVYRDGEFVHSLTTGGGVAGIGWFQMRANDDDPVPVVISADKPITVTQYNSSQQDDDVASDPFQLVLTPIEQYEKEITFNTPGIKGGYGFANNYINICYVGDENGLIPDDMEFATVENGNFVWQKLKNINSELGVPFVTKYQDKTYLLKTLRLPGDGVYKLRAANPFAVYAYGFSAYDSYGFPAAGVFGNVGLQDKMPPSPQWLMHCDGSVEKSDNTYVVDLPNEPENRSNLSLMYMDKANSFNYTYFSDSLVYGTDSYSKWWLEIGDPQKDARAVIVFADKNGNDTTIVINYKGNQVYFSLNSDFAKMNTSEKRTLDAYLCNSSDAAVDIDKIYFQNNITGFAIEGITLPIQIPSKDSIKFQVSFYSQFQGIYKDTLRASNSCITYPKLAIEANVTPMTSIKDVPYDNDGMILINPNPINADAKIFVNLSENTNLKLRIFNDNMQEIQSFNNNQLSAGTYQFELLSSLYSNGVYVCLLEYGSKKVYQKFVVAK